MKRAILFFQRHKLPFFSLIFVLTARFGMHFLGKVFFFGDDFYLTVPGKLFTAEWIKQGVVPFWNPYVMGGVSWIGEVNQSIWYFSTIFFLLFSPALALSLSQALHLVLTFFGSFLMGRSWGLKQYPSTLVAVLWTMGMHGAAALNNLTVLQSLTWIPWIVYSLLILVEHVTWSKALRFSIFFAVLILAGYPQFIFHSVFGGMVLASFKAHLWQRTNWMKAVIFLKYVCIASVFGILLSLIVLAPFIQTLRSSTRVMQTDEQSLIGSVQPIETLKIVIPSLLDSFADGVRWGPVQSADPQPMMYVGWFGLIIVSSQLLSKKSPNLFFSVVILSSLLLSYGGNAPGYEVLQKILPVLRGARNPGLFVLLTTLFFSLWIGSVVQTLNLSMRNVHRWMLALALLALLCVGGLWISKVDFLRLWQTVDNALAGRLSLSSFHTMEIDQKIVEIVLMQMMVSALCGLCSLGFLKYRKYLLFLLVVTIDLWFATKIWYLHAPASVYAEHPNSQLQILLHNPQARVLTSNFNTPYADFGTYYMALAARKPFTDSYVDENELRTFSVARRMKSLLTPNWGSVYGMSTIHGYLTLVPSSVNEYWNMNQNPALNSIPPISLSDPRLKEWSVNRYLTDEWFPGVETPSTPPLQTGIEQKGESWKIFELNALPRFRFADGSSVNLLAFSENPNKISFATEVPADQKKIVIADRWEHGWIALVNEKKAVVRPTDSGLREISVSEGKVEVHMWYSPTLFWVGASVSVCAWVAVFVLVLKTFRGKYLSK